MTDNPKTCADPYLESFARSFTAANYTTGTIRTYRHLVKKLGRLMDAAGIAPSALTPDLADQLARTVGRGRDTAVRFHHFARRFAEHLIDIGVAPPMPLTEAQIARAVLMSDFESYLLKQRGLSPRTIYHTLRFANQFLDHRFGTAMIDLTCLRAADAIGFVQHLVTSKPPYRDKTPATHLRSFFQYLFGRGITATNLALSIPKAAQRWATRLPRHLLPEGVEAVLGAVRANPRHSARDYAMLLLMARLGPARGGGHRDPARRYRLARGRSAYSARSAPSLRLLRPGLRRGRRALPQMGRAERLMFTPKACR